MFGHFSTLCYRGLTLWKGFESETIFKAQTKSILKKMLFAETNEANCTHFFGILLQMKLSLVNFFDCSSIKPGLQFFILVHTKGNQPKDQTLQPASNIV